METRPIRVASKNRQPPSSRADLMFLVDHAVANAARKRKRIAEARKARKARKAKKEVK